VFRRCLALVSVTLPPALNLNCLAALVRLYNADGDRGTVDRLPHLLQRRRCCHMETGKRDDRALVPASSVAWPMNVGDAIVKHRTKGRLYQRGNREIGDLLHPEPCAEYPGSLLPRFPVGPPRLGAIST
jgi:hypothetical protein